MHQLITTTVLVLFATAGAHASEVIYPGYTWHELGNGIYLHSQDDPVAGPVDGNSTVIVGRDGIAVVDTHINPAVTRAVVAKIQSLSDASVTHVVNTHWHDDHTNGNYVYRQAWSDAIIIAHRETLKALREEWQAMEDQRREAYADVDVDALRRDADGFDASDPGKAIGYRVYASYVEALRPELGRLELEYPNTVFEDRMRWNLGDRSLDIVWPGRGNTDGDVVVWLPDERILITGDLLVAPIPFAFDSPMAEWVRTLAEVARFDADMLIPGHGPAQHDHRYLKRVRALLEETLNAVRNAHKNGVAYDDLVDKIDLAEQRNAFTGNEQKLDWAWRAWFLAPGVKSAWSSLGYPVPESD